MKGIEHLAERTNNWIIKKTSIDLSSSFHITTYPEPVNMHEEQGPQHGVEKQETAALTPDLSNIDTPRRGVQYLQRKPIETHNDPARRGEREENKNIPINWTTTNYCYYYLAKEQNNEPKRRKKKENCAEFIPRNDYSVLRLIILSVNHCHPWVLGYY